MLTKWVFFFSLLLLAIGLIKPLQAEQQIKAIVFDFGSVIARTDKQAVVKFISHSLHISQEEAVDAIQQLKRYTLQEKEEQDFWIDYANAKSMILPDQWVEKLNEARFYALIETPGMVNLVKDLQKQGYPTALLSNVRESQAAVKRRLGYYHLFDPVLLSYEIGFKKPHPEAYQILLKRLNLPPQNVLFIDNQPRNVEAAKLLGLDGIVFVSREQLIEELKIRGIEVSSCL
jgi:putative hydrolase of the HAD superfamily